MTAQPDAPKPVITPTGALPVMKTVRAHASNYLALSRHASQIQAITLHSTEGHEGPTAGDAVAHMFARDLRPDSRSSHYVIDGSSVYMCVLELQVAYHCGHRGNHSTIGIELCGTAKQTRAQWLDAGSLPMLQIAARLLGEMCVRYQLPVRALGPDQLRAGDRGITTHAAVSQAWRESTHTDPGPAFPMDDLLVAVGMAVAAMQRVPSPPAR